MSATRNPEMMYKPLPKEDARRGGGTRDPMILWYAPERKWVMVVFNQPVGGKPGFYFFESRDLKNWAETGVLEDMFECPNLFQLPVDGKKDDMRWVTWGSSTEYLIGKFNGPLKVGDVTQSVEIIAGFEPDSATKVGFTGPELSITWNAGSKEIEVNGEKARLEPKNGRVELHILLDTVSVEVVTQGGESYLIKSRDYRNLGAESPLEISAEGGDVTFDRLEVHPLATIWKKM